jgi:drug/metabolite transporter (DMT)-like permease
MVPYVFFSYQMLRGSDMVFTAILSRFIFNQRIGYLRGSGIVLVVIGLVIANNYWFNVDQCVVNFQENIYLRF